MRIFLPMDLPNLKLYSPEDEYTPYKELHIRCQHYHKAETVYFQLVIRSAEQYGYVFNGCDDQSGDHCCKECRRLSCSQFLESFPNLKLLHAVD